MLLFPDERSSLSDTSTGNGVDQMKATVTTTIVTDAIDRSDSMVDQADAKITSLPQGINQESVPIIPSTVSATSVFQQTPSTRKFDADWKTSLQVSRPQSHLPWSHLALTHPYLLGQGHRLRFFAPDELIRLFGFTNIDTLDVTTGKGEETGFFPPGMTLLWRVRTSSLSHDVSPPLFS